MLYIDFFYIFIFLLQLYLKHSSETNYIKQVLNSLSRKMQ